MSFLNFISCVREIKSTWWTGLEFTTFCLWWRGKLWSVESSLETIELRRRWNSFRYLKSKQQVYYGFMNWVIFYASIFPALFFFLIRSVSLSSATKFSNSERERKAKSRLLLVEFRFLLHASVVVTDVILWEEPVFSNLGAFSWYYAKEYHDNFSLYHETSGTKQ